MSEDQRPASRNIINRVFEAVASAFAWPEDADTVPDWRLRQEQRALDIGIIELPHYRTRAEFEAAVALCEAQFAAPELPTVAAMLPPATAAETFLEWLRASGRIGCHTSDQLRDLYGIHCQETGLVPVPENQLRKWLGGGHSPGVSRIKLKGKLNGNRHRPTLWEISTVSNLRMAA